MAGTINQFVHSIAEKEGVELYTSSEAANLLGVSTRTLRRWKHNGVVQAPTRVIQQGGMKINVYTAADLTELRHVIRERRAS